MSDIAVRVDRIAFGMQTIDDGDLLCVGDDVRALFPDPLYELLGEKIRENVPLRCAETLKKLSDQCKDFDLLVSMFADADAEQVVDDHELLSSLRNAAEISISAWHRTRVSCLDELRMQDVFDNKDSTHALRLCNAVKASTPDSYKNTDSYAERAALACDIYVVCGARMIARVQTSNSEVAKALQAFVDVNDFATTAHLRMCLDSIRPKMTVTQADSAEANKRCLLEHKNEKKGGKIMGNVDARGARICSLRRHRSEMESVLDENVALAAKVRRLERMIGEL